MDSYSTTKALFDLICWFEQLEQSVSYIECQEINDDLRSRGIDRIGDLQFSVENHLIRLQSLYDRLLMLTNCLLNLGISDNAVSHEAVFGNKNFKYYKSIAAVVKGVKKTLNPWKEVRNIIVHHRSYDDRRILYLRALHCIENLEYESDRRDMYLRSSSTDSAELEQDVRRWYVQEFKCLNAALFRKIWEVLNLMEKILLYEENFAKIKHQLTVESGR